MMGGQSASLGKLMQPGEVPGALLETSDFARMRPISATMTLRTGSNGSNCTVTRFEFAQALGATVGDGDVHTVLPR